jgi:hypothetical protein
MNQVFFDGRCVTLWVVAKGFKEARVIVARESHSEGDYDWDDLGGATGFSFDRARAKDI